MLAYIIRRIITIFPVFIIVTVIAFILLQLIPGDPAITYYGANPGTPPEVLEEFRRSVGLDKPVYIQYLNFLWRLLNGDLGTNLRTGRPVLEEIAERFPNTVGLALLGMGVALAIAIPVGILSAVKQNSLIDTLSLTLSSLAVSIPNFWLALMLAYVAGFYLRILPISGSGGIQYVILPSLALGVATSGWILRLTRSSMLEVLKQDYMTTAKAKGLSGRVLILKHALKNTLIPVITMIGIRFGYLLGGAVIIEKVFAYPGLGSYTINAVSERNYPVILGSLVIVSMMIAAVNLITDVLYAYLDPRIRYK